MKTTTVPVILAILIVLAGCSAKPTPLIDNSATLVAGTIEAWERSIAQPRTETTPDPTPTILPTNTPEPTKEPSVLDKIADSLEFGYCPEAKTRNAIVEIRALLANADTQTSETETNDLANLTLFDNEEERTAAVEGLKKLVADVEAVPVPECLNYSKSLYLKAMSDTKSIMENFSFGNDDGSWFGDLFKVAMTSSLADDEINKIEQCLPNCEK